MGDLRPPLPGLEDGFLRAQFHAHRCRDPSPLLRSGLAGRTVQRVHQGRRHGKAKLSENFLAGSEELQDVVHGRDLWFLLRRGAHHEQHHRAVPLRSVRPQHRDRWRLGILLRTDEPLCEIPRRYRVRSDRIQVRHERQALGSLDHADPGGRPLHRHGKAVHDPARHARGHDPLLHCRADVRGRFVRRRALHLQESARHLSGFIGAGGNAGSSITQAIFFKGAYSTQDGISYMGAMIIGVTLLVIPIYFPMWGGMFCGPKEGVTESDYYLADFTEEEKAAGIAASVAKFAKEAASERAAVHRPAEVTDKSKSPV